MLSKVWIRGSGLVSLLALTSCQLLTGLEDLELSESTGGQGSGSGPGSGGDVGSGGASPECVVGWSANSTCRGVCGVQGSGIREGCANFMNCYVANECLPETCNKTNDDLCGINSIENGAPESEAMAQEVVDCLCYP